ncbi:MAG: ABC transporter ATP-binding protein [Chitinophagaceae bacterium]
MSTVIQVRNLTKQFDGFRAVSDLSFDVPGGEIYGFLGQNGAGKSTTIRMLLTLIRPSGGTIEILGMNLEKHRQEILRQVGAIIERPDLYKYLTGFENLRLFAALNRVQLSRTQLMEQLERVGLADRANSKVRTYSQGMKQRLGIAIALVHDPALVVLDEPTNGLDPQGIADMRNLILHMSRHLKKTVVVSSHLLSEMELIADNMLIIDKGKKVVEGRARELFNPLETVVELKTDAIGTAWEKIGNSAWKSYRIYRRTDRILLKMPHSELPALAVALHQMDIPIYSFNPKNSLEDYFLSLTSANQHVESFTN